MKPDWKDAPDEARILAQQENGRWVFGSYEDAEPSGLGGWVGIGDGKWFYSDADEGNPNWKKTFERRPSGIETPEEREELDRIQKRMESKKGEYSAYYKDVRHIDYVDVYRVVGLFDCEKHGHAISHAAKKLLLTGARTGGKDVETEVREAIDSLHRWLEMREEDNRAL